MGLRKGWLRLETLMTEEIAVRFVTPEVERDVADAAERCSVLMLALSSNASGSQVPSTPVAPLVPSSEPSVAR